MSSAGEQYPPVEVAYELRFTSRALEDLGVRDDVAPNDFDTILAITHDRDIVEKFREQRHETPTGTRAPMRNVGRVDIYALHGRDGQRACTWFDARASVCWLLGVVSEHNYAELETRAANGELLPSLADSAAVEVENDDFDKLIKPGLLALIDRALADEGEPVRGTVGGLLKLEVAVMAVQLPGTRLVDLFVSVRVPPLANGVVPPENWPGSALVEHIVELATGAQFDELTCEVPAQLPAAGQKWRAYMPQSENALVVRNLEYPDV